MSLRPSITLMFCLVAVAACVLEVTSDACVDKDQSCASYESDHCTSKKEWSAKMCKKFCNYCDCNFHGKEYKHTEIIKEGCLSFICNNGDVRFLTPQCRYFTLPDPKCSWSRPETHCCDLPSCPKGIDITYPGWWDNYEKNQRINQ